MEAFRLLRQRSIESLGAVKHEEFADAAIGLWEQMAAQIIALVGEAGFDSLFAHSVILAQSTFPWLTEPLKSSPQANRFASLRADLAGKPHGLASDANRQLLISFTDTLASLIGASVTRHVLSSAWGTFARYSTTTGEKNE